MKLADRIKSFVAVGALPGALIGFAGDLFTPRGGWLIALICGVLSIIISIVLFLLIYSKKEKFKNGKIYALTTFDGENDSIWNCIHPLKSHSLHVLIIFGVICMTISFKSYALSAKGGILADNASPIKAAQEMLGISHQILVEQKKTNEELGKLNKTAEGLKQEISTDPRKELSNMGVRWEAGPFQDALRASDVRLSKLFLQGEMQISAASLHVAFKSPSLEIHKIVGEKANLFNAADCRSVFKSISADEVLVAIPSAIKMMHEFCSKSDIKIQVQSEFDKSQSFHSEQMAAYNKELALQQSPSDCIKHEKRNGARALIDEVVNFDPSRSMTYTDRETMLGEIKNSMNFGRAGKMDSIINNYCEKQARTEPNIYINDIEVRKWKAIMQWIS